MFAHLESTLLFTAFFAVSSLLVLLTLSAHQFGFMNKCMLMILAILGLASCSSIDQPVAKVALVTPFVQKSEPVSQQIVKVLEEEAKIVANDEMSSVTNRDNKSTAIQHNLSPAFYSARGQFCRFLSDKTTRQLYCKNLGGDWFAVPAVLSDMQALEETLASPLSKQSERGSGND